MYLTLPLPKILIKMRFRGSISKNKTNLLCVSFIILLIFSQIGKSDISNLTFYDEFESLSSEYTLDVYTGNSIYIQNGKLTIDALYNTYAHLEKEFINKVDSIETKVIVQDLDVGASYGPGIGIYWGSSDGLLFNFAYDLANGARLIFAYQLDGEFGQTEVPLTSYSELWLKLEFNWNDFGIYPSYSTDGQNWLDVRSVGQLYSGSLISSLSLSHIDPATTHNVAIGKGFFSTHALAALHGDDLLDTYSIQTLGTSGISEFEYLRIEQSQKLPGGFMDDFRYLGSIVTQDLNPGNSMTIVGEALQITANADTYAHLEYRFDTNVTSIETRLRWVSGSHGVSWGTGIGIYWDGNEGIRLNLADSSGDSIYYSYYLNSEWGRWILCNIMVRLGISKNGIGLEQFSNSTKIQF